MRTAVWPNSFGCASLKLTAFRELLPQRMRLISPGVRCIQLLAESPAPLKAVQADSPTAGPSDAAQASRSQAASLSGREHDHAPQGKAKRKLALHVAYCGTGFAGLQLQKGVSDVSTVEAALEEAIARAGGILESNRGALQKIDWSRSSRTDKGVHSCSTVLSLSPADGTLPLPVPACVATCNLPVIGLKMECDVAGFERDPEGLSMAAAINMHLPRQVRVLAVQRVQQRFDARQACESRVYSYFLPTPVLGLRLDGSAEDSERLALLRACLAAFQGSHAFHSFTKRRLYREPDRRRHRRKRGAPSAAAPAGTALCAAGVAEDAAGPLLEEDASDGEDSHAMAMEGGEEVGQEADAAGGTRDEAEPSSLKTCTSSASLGAAACSQERHADVGTCEARNAHSSREADVSSSSADDDWLPPRVMQFSWNREADDADPITRSHYRHILRATAEDPAQLLPGGVPCVKVVLHGQSFMLHQIRHMMGAAVGVVRGIFPLAWVEACLRTSARGYMPLAPAPVLVLSETVLLPFRDDVRSKIGHLSGDRLELRAGGRTLQQQFVDQVLHPAINELLVGAEWERWEATLQRITYDDAEMAAFLAAHESSIADMERKRAERALRFALERTAVVQAA